VLRRLGIDWVGTPITAALIALYITGLVLLDGHQMHTRVTCFLPGHYHNALNRLLRIMLYRHER
jgi:predicted PurR-regulated permease PerM